MIKTIIIDDEQHCIDRLCTLLQNEHALSIEVVATCTGFEEALLAIQKTKPELVFLDIEINDRTGFELLKNGPAFSFHVIFTTAYSKYAVEAFRFSAVDYLLKPIDGAELSAALDKVQDKILKEQFAQRLEVLFYNLKNVQSLSKKISVPTVSGYVFLHISDIIRCQSEVNYTILFLKDKQKLTVAKTLKEFEEMLKPFNFYRVHNSHLINLAYLKSYHKGKGGFAVMTDNTEIEVSTRKKEDFLKKLKEIF